LRPLLAAAGAFVVLCGLCTTGVLADTTDTTAPAVDNSAFILTPPAPHTPRINGPVVYGERPSRPFIYAIPVSGDRPMTYAVRHLPHGLTLDAKTGIITGTVTTPGTYPILLKARNVLGGTSKAFTIVIGNRIALTPPMGWNSYNVYSYTVDQTKVLTAAKALVADGLNQHGWVYVNTDDTWQGAPDPVTHALQGNDRFPDMAGLVKSIHALGLKAGIYSTPWKGSYSMFPGGSADTPDREWVLPPPDKRFVDPNPDHDFGTYSFAVADANQFAKWGFDYLKYDWNPNDVAHVKEMSDALKSSGRDILFSLSNSATIDNGSEYAQYANAWRTTGDIIDTYESIGENAFTGSQWAKYSGPGHFNDADMMIVGRVGWGNPHPTHLTPDEQYTHVSLWCLLSAPLLIGCDLTKLDPFTRSLLTNDEVLAVDQDPLGKAAVRLEASDDSVTLVGQRPYADPGVTNSVTLPRLQVWAKPLNDGSEAVGLFNLGPAQAAMTAHFSAFGFSGSHRVRDLWRQKNLSVFTDSYTAVVPSHGVILLKVLPAETKK
jgi:alpha-galactosidase